MEDHGGSAKIRNSHHKSPKAILETHHVEVQQKPDPPTGHPQIGQELRLVYRQQAHTAPPRYSVDLSVLRADS